MNITRRLKQNALLLAALACAVARADSPYVLGPIEQVSPDKSSITVLGQTYELSGTMAWSRSVFVGAYVLVSGELLPNGKMIASSVLSAKGSYVPGASEVFLSGPVSSVETQTGFVTVGAVRVYLAETNSIADSDIQVGDSLTLVGLQAQPLGPIWAIDSRIEKPAISSQAIQGTGAIEGTDTNAIQGTGLQAIQGTGALAIQGTGTLAIQGTGALAIQGTGTQAIQGTGIQAIQGTGSLAIQGTGALAIQGTGALAIQGTGTLAIQGTGALAIQGTGTQAIQGTGIQAIQGTGSLAIQGTGTQAIQGTGLHTSQGSETYAIQGTGM